MAKKPTPKETEQIIPGAVEIDPLKQAQIEAEVRAELEAEQQELAEAALKRELKTKLKREMLANAGLNDGEELAPITIDLAPHADKIRIDGVDYYQGHTYNVAPQAIATFNEIMGRTWWHEEDISDRRGRHNAYRKPYDRKLDGKTAA